MKTREEETVCVAGYNKNAKQSLENYTHQLELGATTVKTVNNVFEK
jgi:hypothetical protein